VPEAAPGWGSCSTALSEYHDVLLLDLDGVVYVGPQAVPEAPEALEVARRAGVRLAYVTNNAARPPDIVARHLTELGVPAEATDVVTSAQAAAAMLSAELPRQARVLAVGGAGLRQALIARGLTPVASAEDGPVAVVQGFAPETSWWMLLEACVAVNAGLPWVATNLDLTIPTPRGTAPGNGALVQVVRTATGKTPRVAGKPFRPLMDESCERTGAVRALVVGDRLDTDIAGAHAAGLPSLLVLTGVSGAADLLRATPELRPTYLAADLWGLHQPHAAPRREDGSWVGAGCRATWVEVHGDAGVHQDSRAERDARVGTAALVDPDAQVDGGPGSGAPRLVVEPLASNVWRRETTAVLTAPATAGTASSAGGLSSAGVVSSAGVMSSAGRVSGAGTESSAGGVSSAGTVLNGGTSSQTDEGVQSREPITGAKGSPPAEGSAAGVERAGQSRDPGGAVSGDTRAAFVDALRVVCAAVWDRVDAAASAAERDRIIAAGEHALLPWTTGPERGR
jgi:glycerol-1-phosphatase